MNTKLIACKTLGDELRLVMGRLHLDYEIVWIESGLHNTPNKLNKRLQEELDSISCDRLLTAFGRCGSSLQGLIAGDYEWIIPRVDDCISLLFGSDAAREEYGRQNAAIFLTEGWMRGERNIWVEYQHAVEKYGEETAQDISEMMYGHYRELALLDTGAFPIEKLWNETVCIEEKISLKRKITPATLTYIEKLLTGPWTEEEFYIFPPHTQANLQP